MAAMCAYIWQRCAAIYSEHMRLLIADACGVLGAYLLEHLDPHRAGCAKPIAGGMPAEGHTAASAVLSTI